MKLKHLTLALTAIAAVTFLSGCEEELAEKLHDLQILEKRAKDLFFSGTVFTSAYDA